ncbi:MAG: Holliday junction branch migration protein RuvA [Patescibacteria group bacterium]|nr:Holliday junction branch migration protein RuvA [Patescibacteria group bacterium]
MIGKIRGKLIEISGNIGLIETNSGVSYEVYLTSQFISEFKISSLVDIYTYLHIREDAMILFGFKEKKEYEIFKMLLTVSGVGPKTAFNIISYINFKELINIIKSNNIDGLTSVPGLGKKTAMKIILELSSKLDSEFEMKNMVLSEEDKTVVDALISLGYKSQDAKKILSRLPKNLSIEEKIKEGLKIKNK